MKLELGKRYVRRDGEVTGPLEITGRGKSTLQFYDPKHAYPYTPDGLLFTYEEHAEDLIREYIEGDALTPESGSKASPSMRNADLPASKMTKREAIAAQVAGHVFQQLIATGSYYKPEKVATDSKNIADALLAELENANQHTGY